MGKIDLVKPIHIISSKGKAMAMGNNSLVAINTLDRAFRDKPTRDLA